MAVLYLAALVYYRNMTARLPARKHDLAAKKPSLIRAQDSNNMGEVLRQSNSLF